MKVNPITNLNTFKSNKVATTWEDIEAWEWNDPTKNPCNKNDYRPDDGGCIRKDIVKSGETLDIII